MSKFTESDVCKSRQYCVACRRDPRFRENFEKQTKEALGECPLGIEIDAKDDKFPKDILDRYNQQQEQMKESQRKQELAKEALDELSLVLTGENLTRLDTIRSVFFPQTKVASKCKNSSKKIGEVDQVCCGGKIKKVDTFDCSKHTLCTDRKCNTCPDFTTKS